MRWYHISKFGHRILNGGFIFTYLKSKILNMISKVFFKRSKIIKQGNGV